MPLQIQSWFIQRLSIQRKHISAHSKQNVGSLSVNLGGGQLGRYYVGQLGRYPDQRNIKYCISNTGPVDTGNSAQAWSRPS